MPEHTFNVNDRIFVDNQWGTVHSFERDDCIIFLDNNDTLYLPVAELDKAKHGCKKHLNTQAPWSFQYIAGDKIAFYGAARGKLQFQVSWVCDACKTEIEANTARKVVVAA